MVCLKEINLTEAEKQKQKVIDIAEELQKEQNKLRDMLVALNLEYYGTTPSNYYKSIKKCYVTDDGYSVIIEKGVISICKRIQTNLTITWSETFNETTAFSIYRCSFEYDSGRHTNSSIVKGEIAAKHKNEIKRMQEILKEEQIYNPFLEFSGFYSFIDFYNNT